MKKRVKIAAVIAAAVTVIATIYANAQNIHVNLDGLSKADEIMNVDFEYVAPINMDGISMVPIRAVCEDAGMSVIWQQSVNAVVIKLEAVLDSERPIEKYAYGVLAKKAAYEEQMIEPECIIVTMYLNSEEATLHYNYKDSAGNIVSYGKKLDLPKSVTMIGNGTLAAPLRTMFDQFGLLVNWDAKSSAVSITIPEIIGFEAGVEPVLTYDPQADVVQDNRIYLGNFRISHYCACSKCCGEYVGQTAWGGDLRPGYTIAVDPSVIGKLATVEIDGYGLRVAEDCGGAIKGNRIDVAVSSHEEAMSLGVVYRDVWLVG